MVEWNEDGSIPPATVLWVVSACEKKLIEKVSKLNGSLVKV